MPARDLATDFDKQLALLPEVKKACAPYLIHQSKPEDDMKRNTDLTVDPNIRISVRIRSYEDLHKNNYANEFTIRADRPSGAETELSKVISGWGTHTFYGFANSDYTGFAAWMLGDLNVFRRWFTAFLATNSGTQPGVLIPNTDGSSSFRAFTISELPPDFVIARLTADMGEIARQVVDISNNAETTTSDSRWLTEYQRGM